MSGLLNRTVMWVTLRQLFASQRLVTTIVVSLVPLALAAIFSIEPSRTGMDAGKFLLGMYRELVVGTILPLAAIVFGTSAFSAEVTDGTIVYLLVKPEPRWRVVASKFVVATFATLAVMLPTVFLPWLTVDHAVMPMDVPLTIFAGAAIGAVLYSALFIALGLSSKRALVFGLLYVVLVEFVLSRNAAGVKSFSIRELTLAAITRIGEGNRWIGPADVTINTAWTMGTLFLVGSLAFAWHRYRRFEMAEKL